MRWLIALRRLHERFAPLLAAPPSQPGPLALAYGSVIAGRVIEWRSAPEFIPVEDSALTLAIDAGYGGA